MDVKINFHNNFFNIESSSANSRNEEKIDEFFFKVLRTCFSEQDITAVTREPQAYSLGWELQAPVKMRVDNIEILVNRLGRCEIDILEEIFYSEEFKRGLLAVIIVHHQALQITISQFLEIEKSYPPIGGDAIAFREADGDVLTICNSKLTVEHLQQLQSGKW